VLYTYNFLVLIKPGSHIPAVCQQAIVVSKFNEIVHKRMYVSTAVNNDSTGICEPGFSVPRQCTIQCKSSSHTLTFQHHSKGVWEKQV
jgi:hypothetical protein